MVTKILVVTLLVVGVVAIGMAADRPRKTPPAGLRPTTGPLTLPGATAKAMVAIAKDREAKSERDLGYFDIYIDPTPADRIVIDLMPRANESSSAEYDTVRETMYEVSKRTFEILHKAYLK
jgi:hypothetical protein